MNIDGVMTVRLRIIRDGRGEVRHMLRRTDPWFTKFGEIYFSLVAADVVKAWHLHRSMRLAYACIYGAIRLELYDARSGSETAGLHQTIYLADHPPLYELAIIPPGIWNGFRAIGPQSHAIVANCADMPHDPDEIERLPVMPTFDSHNHQWRKDVGWGYFDCGG